MSSHATRQGALVHSRLSSLSHYALILAPKRGLGAGKLIFALKSKTVKKTPAGAKNATRTRARVYTHTYTHAHTHTHARTLSHTYTHTHIHTHAHTHTCTHTHTHAHTHTNTLAHS